MRTLSIIMHFFGPSWPCCCTAPSFFVFLALLVGVAQLNRQATNLADYSRERNSSFPLKNTHTFCQKSSSERILKAWIEMTRTWLILINESTRLIECINKRVCQSEWLITVWLSNMWTHLTRYGCAALNA